MMRKSLSPSRGSGPTIGCAGVAEGPGLNATASLRRTTDTNSSRSVPKAIADLRCIVEQGLILLRLFDMKLPERTVHPRCVVIDAPMETVALCIFGTTASS